MNDWNHPKKKYSPAPATVPSLPVSSSSQIRSLINHITLENKNYPVSFAELFLKKEPGEGRVDKLNTIQAKTQLVSFSIRFDILVYQYHKSQFYNSHI